MDPVPIIVSAVVVVLTLPLGRVTARQRLPLHISVLETQRISVLRALLLLMAGAAWGWGLSVLGMLDGHGLALWLILLLGLGQAAGRAGESTVPGTLAFLEQLESDLTAGADFFVALAAAAPALTGRRERRAADLSLRSFSERRSLQDCLRPLSCAGPYFETLAAEVQQTGWEHSSALVLSVSQLRLRMATSWRRRQRGRLWVVRLARRLPALLTWSAGVGLTWILGIPFPLQQGWQIAAGVLLLHGIHTGRFPVRKWALTAALLLVWVSPAVLNRPVRDIPAVVADMPQRRALGRDFGRLAGPFRSSDATDRAKPVGGNLPPSSAVIWNRIGTGTYLWKHPGQAILVFVPNGAWVELTDTWGEKGGVPFGEVLTAEGLRGWLDMTDAHRMARPDEAVRYVRKDRGAYLYDAPQGRAQLFLVPGTPVLVPVEQVPDRIIPVQLLVGGMQGWISADQLMP